MIINPTGMICDGAKLSCASKAMTGMSAVILPAVMVMENHCVISIEGVIDEDVD